MRAELHSSAGPAGWNLLLGPGISVSKLLTDPAVRKDLKLTDDQVHQIATITSRRHELPGLAHDDAAKEQACFEVLHPEQAKLAAARSSGSSAAPTSSPTPTWPTCSA